jgi:hypothetical protein
MRLTEENVVPSRNLEFREGLGFVRCDEARNLDRRLTVTVCLC